MKCIVWLFAIFIMLNHDKVFANGQDDTQIQEGIYEIYTNVSDTKVINVENGSYESGANVNIYERENRNSQKFQVIKNTDGTYTFKAVHSNKVLDVVTGGKANGTNVWQYESNGTDAQKWYVKPCENGYYSILSKCNDLYLDIAGAGTQNGTNVQVCEGNGTKAQKFRFSKVQPLKGEKTLEEGIYQISSQVAPNRVLEIPNHNRNDGAIVKTAEVNQRANQKFKITYHQEDGTYSIQVMHSKKVFDVQGAGNRNGTLVQQYSSNDTDAQKWIFIKNEDDTYSIVCKCNGLALDVRGASKEEGAILQSYYYKGTDEQKFKLQPCLEEQGTQSAEDGTYRILSKVNHNKIFDVAYASKANGGIIQIWNNERVIQQKFKIEYVGEGYYKIKAKISNKVLTVESENPKEGSKITQQEDEDLETQKWILKKQEESVYAIVSKCGNLYIDLGDVKAECGQSLILQSETDLENQQFILVNETPTQNLAQMENGIYKIALKSNYVIDVSGGSYGNVANIQIWTNENVQQQKFQITRIDDNSNVYKITAVHSAKVLDVQGANCNCGANVNQYESNGTDAQFWYVRDCGDGYYNIISKLNGLCLDIAGGNIFQNGNNAQLFYDNKTDAQKFKFIPVSILDNNTYEIETKLNSNMVVDVSGATLANGGNVQLWGADNAQQQRFVFEALSRDTYKIIAKHSNKVLTVDSNTGNVYQSEYSGRENQKWRINPAGEGYYKLICIANQKALDVSGAIANNGQNMQVFNQHNTDAQKFRFVTGFRKFYEEGNYGRSGLAIAGDGRGSNLKYYKYGKGWKVLFANFSIHGFEDSYNHDGAELTYIAEEFKKYLDHHIDENIVNNWTIYIFPCLNPDGQTHGYTQNGPGRNTLFSAAPGNKGIDMNRNWSIGYKRENSNRYYNGTAPFQAYEAASLRDFIVNHQGIQSNITVDTHGWLNETIGDEALGSYYRNYFGLPNHIHSYGSGYLVNWARTLRNGRSVLVELPQVSNHNQVVERNYVRKIYWSNNADAKGELKNGKTKYNDKFSNNNSCNNCICNSKSLGYVK